MNISRRGFLGSLLALGAAPAIVRIGSLMPVRSIVLPTTAEVIVANAMTAISGNTLLTISAITAEALKILEKQLTEWKPQVRAYDIHTDIHFSRLVRR